MWKTCLSPGVLHWYKKKKKREFMRLNNQVWRTAWLNRAEGHWGYVNQDSTTLEKLAEGTTSQQNRIWPPWCSAWHQPLKRMRHLTAGHQPPAAAEQLTSGGQNCDGQRLLRVSHSGHTTIGNWTLLTLELYPVTLAQAKYKSWKVSR